MIFVIRRVNRMGVEGEGKGGHLHLRRTFLIHLRKDLRFGFRCYYLEPLSGHHYLLGVIPKQECDRLNT